MSVKGKLSHPLGKPVAHNTKGAPVKPAAKGKAPVSGVQQAVNVLKPIVKLPFLAAQASNTELRKP